jgi:DeoR/GlpR family transcriptional regulator of sugar metabolism
LKQDGKIVAKSAAAQLDVSEDTIRRDLRELASEGLLQQVHGGALPASPAMADFAARQHISTDDKSASGRAAALLIQPGQVVFIDGGTTSAQLVRHLPPDLRDHCHPQPLGRRRPQHPPDDRGHHARHFDSPGLEQGALRRR